MQKHPDWNMVSDFEMYVRHNFRIHIDIFGEFLVSHYVVWQKNKKQ